MSVLPKVSVCMITYNHAAFIEQAIESVMMQETDFTYELVVGEDCSTDRTREILLRCQGRHSARVRSLLRDSNLGMIRNFSETYGACRGEYIALLEGDDYWLGSDKLQKQVDALESHPEWAICGHRVRYVNAEGADVGLRFPRDFSATNTIWDEIEAPRVQTCAAMVRSRNLRSIPSWFSELGLADWPFFMLHAQHGLIGTLDAELAAYRMHADGLWSMRPHHANVRAKMKMYRSLQFHLPGEFTAPIRRQRGCLHEQLANMRSASLSGRRRMNHRRAAWRCLSLTERLRHPRRCLRILRDSRNSLFAHPPTAAATPGASHRRRTGNSRWTIR